ncbi:MgtC/SapB family protein [Candidatus Uhrbacteria bacterium]|nr:MgtC/SapB family protein [Candidatus Uhrbacteria bacterium]
MDQVITIHELELFLRLFLAAVVGWLIGYEREVLGKAAGTRTFGLVALGSALFAIVSSEGFTEYIGESAADPTRVTSLIVSGIGFLGAGLIIFRGDKVEGLTTAAGLWAVAAVGMAFGRGLYTLGIFSAILILLLLYTSRWIHPEHHDLDKK